MAPAYALAWPKAQVVIQAAADAGAGTQVKRCRPGHQHNTCAWAGVRLKTWLIANEDRGRYCVRPSQQASG